MKDICTAVEHVMAQERADQGFHIGIFEQAHAASAHIKAAYIGIHAKPKVRSLPAADYGMEMKSSLARSMASCNRGFRPRRRFSTW